MDMKEFKKMRRIWLPIQGSNLGKRIQSPLCYHYTNRQSAYTAEGRGRTDMRVAPQWFLRPSRLPIPPLRLENKWSGRRDSNSRPPPWQGGILPLNYFRSKKCRGPESDWRHADFQSAALPTELPRHNE